ncbi:MAG: glycine cleavage system aminomethyltransferase GcvT [Candidatus Eiseniibacteriota bacterium]|jgi:aminomethyltransferase
MRRTPLFESHEQLGARLVDFAGWEMPVYYDSIIAEHQAVRERAGLFDVSHMGEFRVHGPGAEAFIDRMVANAVGGIEDGQALYTPMCNERGGTVDDLIVYRLAAHDYLMVVNASNIDKDFAWLEKHVTGDDDVQLRNLSDEVALLAVQGPRAVEILARGGGDEVADIGYYRFRRLAVWGIPAIVARLGYTGEDGFELMVEGGGAARLWKALREAGTGSGLAPAGLGARDTLRFEAGYCLYGHELTDEIGPLEAGIGWAVKLQKEEFIGADPLRQQKAAGLERKLVALEMDGRRVPRQGATVLAGRQPIGEVTSGMFAPTLGCPAALALVRRGVVGTGDAVEIDLRGTPCAARVVRKPLYKRAR